MGWCEKKFPHDFLVSVSIFTHTKKCHPISISGTNACQQHGWMNSKFPIQVKKKKKNRNQLPDKWCGIAEFPSHNITPLIKFQWQVTVSPNPLGIIGIHDCLTGWANGYRHFQIRLPRFCHPRDLSKPKIQCGWQTSLLINWILTKTIGFQKLSGNKIVLSTKNHWHKIV